MNELNRQLGGSSDGLSLGGAYEETNAGCTNRHIKPQTPHIIITHNTKVYTKLAIAV